MFMLAWGTAFFPGLFFISRKVLKSVFKSWNDADVFVVSERLVSSIHATLATIVGFIIATASSDVMYDRHRLTNEFVWFGAPYMAFDIYAMYLSNYHCQKLKGHEAYRKHSLLTIKLFLLRHPLLVVHHMVLLTVFMPTILFLRTGLGGDFFIGCFFMAEFSTPFVSLGKVLIQLGLEDSWLHRVNGVMVLLSFFTCRILLFPYMYWVYGQQYTIPFHKVPFHLPLHCNLANLSILSPQIYWFMLLCHKAYRLYLRQTRSKGQLAHKDGSKTD
uniref:TLC domain-containing protein 3A-like n=1 Tax=Oncorhynchus gorbuscha TaxID=8017 RepID=UPI001EAF221A|nr:TLC domain-containing protein 3A-like [Oncorhynchus gorbuscha]